MPQKTNQNSHRSIASVLQKAEEYCLLKGGRLTLKRKQLLSILLSEEKAISAYELIDLFKGKFNIDLPAMSVYRILDYLISSNLVHKIHVANKFVACTHIGCQENHNLSHLLFCQECQRVQELPISSSIYMSFTDDIKKSGNKLCTQHIELTCICSLCSNSSKPLHLLTPTYN